MCDAAFAAPMIKNGKRAKKSLLILEGWEEKKV
jgi:hypothetical protein